MLQPGIFIARILRVSRGEKLTTGLISFHLAKSDYGMIGWPNQGVISHCQYSKIFIIKTSCYDRSGHSGVKLRKLRLGMRIHALSSFRPQICYLLNSWSKGMGCIQFNYHFHPVPPWWESTHFSEDPSLSSVPCRCTSGPWGDSIIDLLERKVMTFHEISMNMEFCKSQLIRQGHLIPLFNKNAWTWKTGHRLERNRRAVHYWYYRKKAEILTLPRPPQKQERKPILASAFQMNCFWGPRSKLCRSETQNSK